jgi:hypothetical protein
MGDLADYCDDRAFQEMFRFSYALDTEMEHTSGQDVVNRVIKYFRENSVNTHNKLEVLCKEILTTVKRTKRLSDKQKSCLLTLLIQREDDWEERYS